MTDTQAITIRLPRDIYENLRRESFETREPMNTVIVGTLRSRFDGTVTVRADDLRALLDAADPDYLQTRDLPDLEERIERLHATVEPEDTQ